MIDKVKNLGQVFTPPNIVDEMTNLIENKGNVLEPSSGNGAFSKIKGITSIEIDPENKTNNNIIMDFFDYDIINKFPTIIGNPPYVSFKNIPKETLTKIQHTDYLTQFDNRSNLFLFFIRKCLEHLTENGELIFITPREFIKATSFIRLNTLMHSIGTITHWYEYGDKNLFKGYSPNVVIWRFQKNNFTKKTKTFNGVKNFTINDGQISFTSDTYKLKFSDLFFVKVGAVSGCDGVFTNENGNMDFVCSYTNKTNELKTMYHNVRNEFIDSKKDVLINRKMKKFDENNWWQWGRWLYESNSDRVYVNCKTRNLKPFFTNECKYYDGSVLAIFPKTDINITQTIELLNNVDWDDLGFKNGGRLCFTQKSLENCYLPNEFNIIKPNI